MLIIHKTRCLHHIVIFLMNLLIFASATTQLDLIPLLCDSIDCPADADMQCPEDSSIREIREINAVDLMHANAVSVSSTLAPMVKLDNSSLVPHERFAQCCLSKKCICKTCYIPSCNSEEGEVVVELKPESMDTPGKCCGQFECRKEPDCSVLRETDYHWLQSCQRCRCTSGERLCQQNCDEDTTAICESKNLNRFFKDGESWEDGCYECECVKGEQKCVISFCRNVYCPIERQVNLKDECCPVCWPKGAPMPHEKPRNYDDGYGYEHEQQQQQRPEQPHETETETETEIESDTDTDTELPIVPLEPLFNSPTSTNRSTTSIPSTSSTTTTTQRVATHAAAKYEPSNEPTTTAPPCQNDFSNIVELVHPTKNNDPFYLTAIGFLAIVIAVMYIYIRHLQAKQRSYRPVSNFDDKV